MYYKVTQVSFDFLCSLSNRKTLNRTPSTSPAVVPLNLNTDTCTRERKTLTIKAKYENTHYCSFYHPRHVDIEFSFNLRQDRKYTTSFFHLSLTEEKLLNLNPHITNYYFDFYGSCNDCH